MLIAALAFAAAARAADECRPELQLSLAAEVDTNGHISIPLTVNGHTVQVLFCTSCGWSSLGERFVDKAGIAKRQAPLRFVDPAGNEPNYYVAADEVKLGDIVFKGKAEFLVDDGSDRGTLGLNLMANFDVEIDNTKRIVSFYRYAACERPAIAWLKDAVEIPFHLKDGLPKGVLELKGKELKGKRLQTGIATGVTYTSMAFGIARHQLGVAPETPGLRRIGGVQYGDKVYDRYEYLLPELTISGLRFTNVPVRLIDLESYGLQLGMHELKQLRLYIAFQKKRIYVAPIGTSP